MDLQAKIQKAKQAGYSDTEIQAYMQQKGLIQPTSPVSATETPKPEEKSFLQGNLQNSNLFSGNGFLSNIANTLSSPAIRFGQMVGGASYEAGRALARRFEGENAYLDQKGNTVQNPFMSEQDLAKFSDPRQGILEGLKRTAGAESYLIPFGKGANIASKVLAPGAAVGGLSEISRPGSTGESVVTAGALGAGAAGLLPLGGKMVGGLTKYLPERLMNSVYKEPLKVTKAAVSKGESLGRQALDRGQVGSTQHLYNLANTQINNTENTLQQVLMGSNKKVAMSIVRKTVQPLMDDYTQAGNTTAVNGLKTRLDAIEAQNGKNIPVALVNQIKRSLYDEAQKAYGTEASAGMEGIKAIARGFKEALVDIPGVDQLNKDLSFYGRQRNAMLDKMTKDQRNNLIGLSDIPIAIGGIMPGAQLPALASFAAKKALGSTIGKTSIAQGLNKIGKMVEKLPSIPPQLGGQVAARLPVFKQQSSNNSIQQKQNPQQSQTPPSSPNSIPQDTRTILVNGQPLDEGQMQLIRDIANYKVDISKVTSLRSDQRQKLAEMVAVYDPSWDMTQYGARQALRRDFTSGKGANNIRSLNTAIGHLNSLSQAGNELGNTSIPALNALKNVAGQSVGQPQVTKFNNAVNAVAGEMSTVFKGTSGTDQEIKSWKDQMNMAQSPDQINAGINQMIELMGSRLAAFTSQWESGMGKPKDFVFLSPNSRKILKGLGIDPDVIDPYQSQGLPAQPPLNP